MQSLSHPDHHAPRVHCPFCAADFVEVSGLLGHLGERHRGERPVLLLRGIEAA